MYIIYNIILNNNKYVFICIYFYIYLNIDGSWICFLRGLEDDLIKVETCRPDNTLF